MRPEILEPYVPTNKQRQAIVIGAHEGYWVAKLSPLFDAIYAMEPSPEAIKKLRNLSLPNVKVSAAAAWIETTRLAFHLRSDASSALACRDIRRSEEVIETIEVAGIGIDDLNFSATSKGPSSKQ